jgi:hypothetical protein
MARFALGIVALIGCTLGLAGCGNGNNNAEKPDALEPTMLPPWWNATDACSIVDKKVMAEVLKQDVSDAQLSLTHAHGKADAAMSQCSYVGRDGAGIATLVTRWSPIKDNTADAIAEARATTESAAQAFGDAEVEDIPDLGKAAFFVPKINQLTVFIDDQRMIMVTPTKLPASASGKDLAIALARKAGARSD